MTVNQISCAGIKTIAHSLSEQVSFEPYGYSEEPEKPVHICNLIRLFAA